MNVKLLCIISLLFITGLLSSCGGGSDDESSEQTGTVTGYVVSAVDDTPVSGATVRSGSAETTTAIDGSYSLQTAVGERVVVHIDAENFAEAFPVALVSQDETVALRTRLLIIGVNAPIDVATGGTVIVPASAAQVTLPAGGLVPSDGSAASASVNVAVTPINPATDPGFMPGDYTAIAAGEDEPVTIESFGAMLVDIRDDNGTRYNLAEGSTATIRIPLGTRSDSPPATIPLFYFNEITGLWVEEGSATLAGVAPDQYYEGTVTHFSYWNADRVMETIYVSGCVEDVNGDPVSDIAIRSDGSNYSGQDYSRSASDGSFSVALRQDSEATIVGLDQNWQVTTNEVSVGPYQSDYSMTSCLTVTPPPLAITTTSLPAGAVDIAYSTTLIGSGGYPPYQWSVSAAQLPTGLQLNVTTGEVYGTPTTEGDSSFTIQLQDSSNNPQSSVNKPFEMTIDWLSARSITEFSLAGIAGDINEATGTIAVTMPYGTDVTALVAAFSTSGIGTSVRVGPTVQSSGSTANDFTSPVTYTVIAADGTPAYYTITATVEAVTSTAWSMVSASSGHTAAVKSDGTLWAWGHNGTGQLGDGTTVSQATPNQIGVERNWSEVFSGSASLHTIAIKIDGTLWAWGHNGYGELGDGTQINRHIPVQIGVDSDWSSVSTGMGHTMAIKSDGTLWAWGNNHRGQLGDGTTVRHALPVQVGTENNWIEVSAGWIHTVAIKSDKTLWGWGFNGNGQLGDEIFNYRTIPTQIGASSNWSEVATGLEHTVAIESNGSLWTWGGNDEGQLGDGTTSQRAIPTQIVTANGWSTLSAGETHTIAITLEGALWAWGNNHSSRLGDGTGTNRVAPVQIGTESNWSTVSAGHLNSMAIQSDGSLWGMGFDIINGVIGAGTPTNIP